MKVRKPIIQVSNVDFLTEEWERAAYQSAINAAKLWGKTKDEEADRLKNMNSLINKYNK